ncbi:MAG: YciI family protein [Candidatus Obscuribacterales bacterium]|nr:YciI family protein [Candidatus Obscuribacterales bacterium]
MQFLIIAKDGSDEKALERRLSVRSQHLERAAEMHDSGEALYGAAILNESEQMVGSVMICEFPSRKELDEWLDSEPYVRGGVWRNIEVFPCNVAPMFV